MQGSRMTDRTLGGRYLLEDLVGGGGFADVYRAHDLRSNNRVVAVKILHAHIARDPTLLRHFDREARLARGLNDAHIVRVLDAGKQEGTHYLVMEYVHGRTLAQVLKERGPLPIGEAVALALQVLEALEVAHAAGIVHRDIKPQNLMLTTGGLLKVMDFGTAKAPGTGTKTKTGMYLGTPHYMSPEQATGGPVDRRSDLYALGCTLFELVAGHPPFHGATDWQIIAGHVCGQPPRLQDVRPDVPPLLQEVVARAIEKLPSQRFQSAAEMRNALVSATGSPSANNWQQAAGRRGALWVGRWGAWAPVGAAGAVGLLLALLLATRTPLAQQPFNEAYPVPAEVTPQPEDSPTPALGEPFEVLVVASSPVFLRSEPISEADTIAGLCNPGTDLVVEPPGIYGSGPWGWYLVNWDSLVAAEERGLCLLQARVTRYETALYIRSDLVAIPERAVTNTDREATS